MGVTNVQLLSFIGYLFQYFLSSCSPGNHWVAHVWPIVLQTAVFNGSKIIQFGTHISWSFVQVVCYVAAFLCDISYKKTSRVSAAAFTCYLLFYAMPRLSRRLLFLNELWAAMQQSVMTNNLLLLVDDDSDADSDTSLERDHQGLEYLTTDEVTFQKYVSWQ